MLRIRLRVLPARRRADLVPRSDEGAGLEVLQVAECCRVDSHAHTFCLHNTPEKTNAARRRRSEFMAIGGQSTGCPTAPMSARGRSSRVATGATVFRPLASCRVPSIRRDGLFKRGERTREDRSGRCPHLIRRRSLVRIQDRPLSSARSELTEPLITGLSRTLRGIGRDPTSGSPRLGSAARARAVPTPVLPPPKRQREPTDVI